MKGIIFTLLSEVVIEKFGIDTWESVLEDLNPSNQGIYISGKSYAGDELLAIITHLSKKLSIDIPELVRTYGQALFSKLAKKYPVFLKDHINIKSFLMSVDEVIHIEVEKIFHKPNLPKFNYIDEKETDLIMLYQSPRKLCALAEGLIMRASAYFHTDVSINHSLCMHHGSDHCWLELNCRNL